MRVRLDEVKDCDLDIRVSSESLGVQLLKCLATIVSLPDEMSLK